MRIDLPRGTAYSYSLAPNDVVEVTVLQGGPVEHRSPSGEVTGGIASGATESLNMAGMLVASDGAAVVELAYSTPGVPETLEWSPDGPSPEDQEEESDE